MRNGWSAAENYVEFLDSKVFFDHAKNKTLRFNKYLVQGKYGLVENDHSLFQVFQYL